jgi:hypothetical protein
MVCLWSTYPFNGGAGGPGGGGAGTGASSGGIAGVAGTVNTGGGGGGSSKDHGGLTDGGAAGGSGIIVIRAPGPAGSTISLSPGANTKTTLPAPAGGCTVATFTVSGTLTIAP